MKDNEKKDRFNINIRSNTKDLFAFTKLVPERKKRIKKASSEPIKSDPIKDLVSKLHPEKQYLKIKSIKEETETTRTYRLVPDNEKGQHELAYFRAGQYLSLKVNVDETYITRPYSISSAPYEALEGYYDITIRKEEHGFLTNYIWDNWKVGTKIKSSGPEGFFYLEPLRDKKNIVGLAGGSGITPFRSMIKEIIHEGDDYKLTLLYGSSDEKDIIFYDELMALEKEHHEKFKLVVVLSCEEVSLEGCETGFLTSEIIQKYTNINESTFFICGPQVMYNFVEKELNKCDLLPKQIRREAFGEIKEIVNLPGFPSELSEKVFQIKVHIGNLEKNIPAAADESVLVAMERAKLAPPSKCRSGECGFCRALLMSGNVYISPINDGRRGADKKFNYFHPCSSYPISDDIEIKIPRSS